MHLSLFGRQRHDAEFCKELICSITCILHGSHKNAAWITGLFAVFQKTGMNFMPSAFPQKTQPFGLRLLTRQSTKRTMKSLLKELIGL
jgi:hypothetical protein